jgi:hypothetical protein
VQLRDVADVNQGKAKTRQRWDGAVKEFLDRVKGSRKIRADDRSDDEAWIDRNEFDRPVFGAVPCPRCALGNGLGPIIG